MKSLICLTHFDRPDYLATFAPSFYDFCLKNSHEFNFLIAVDGCSNELIEVCKSNSFPYLISDKNEGVGITKNRVLSKFTGYHYYFFLDDDVELRDSSIFRKSIHFAVENRLHHFSLGENFRFFGNRIENKGRFGTIIYSDYGSGAFNFFSSKGLAIVGGFHDSFATYKRFGHTEHSTRFKNNDLAPSAFIMPESFENYLIWHNPKSSKPNVANNENRIAVVEQKIIDQALKYYPIKTICQYQNFAGAIPSWFPLKNNSLCFLPKKEAKMAMARRYIVRAKSKYLSGDRTSFIFDIFLYLYHSFPQVKFKKIIVISCLNCFLDKDVIEKEFKKIRF